MKITAETRESWKYRVKLRDIINHGKQVTDCEDSIGVASQKALIEAVTWAACVTLAGLLILGALLFFPSMARAEQIKASWYSEASLKKEGTWKTSKGVMANGKKFDEKKLTCATRLYPLGTMLRIIEQRSGRMVNVLVTDRIGIRFARKRIDLSKAAFQRISNLCEGLIDVEVREVRHE